MDWGMSFAYLTPIAAMTVALFVYVAIATWIEDRRRVEHREWNHRKAA